LRSRPSGLLLDLDGTVYEDGALIPGADEAIAELRERGIPVRFVTNTTRVSRATIAGWLKDLGVAADPGDIFTPPVAAASWLRGRGIRRIALCLPEDSSAELAGFDVVEERPEAVVIGDLGPAWTFDILNRVFRWLLDGVEFVALHRNRYWKTGGELVLDVGAFVAALEFASGREATLVGKPSRAMFEAAARSMGLGLGDVAMVGDDLRADVAGAQALGLPAFMVRSGKFRVEELASSEIVPDLVVESLAALPELLSP
jgi:phospholysine phosphohistidine inorganic pyrophosphate phosphatase